MHGNGVFFLGSWGGGGVIAVSWDLLATGMEGGMHGGLAGLREALHGGWRDWCDLKAAALGFDRRSKQWPTGTQSTLAQAQGWCVPCYWCPFLATGMLKLLGADRSEQIRRL